MEPKGRNKTGLQRGTARGVGHQAQQQPLLLSAAAMPGHAFVWGTEGAGAPSGGRAGRRLPSQPPASLLLGVCCCRLLGLGCLIHQVHLQGSECRPSRQLSGIREAPAFTCR